METKLSKSFAEVRKVINENVKCKEENKTLLGIHKANAELHEELKKARSCNQESKQQHNDSVEIVDDDSVQIEDDEESAAFNLFQRKNGFKRNDPASEASRQENTNQNSAKQQETRLKLTCEKCGFKAKNETILIGHATGHNIKCEVCQAVFKTVGLLRRHKSTDHSGNSGTGNRMPPPAPNTDAFTIKCILCDFTAASNIQIQKHMKIRHETENKTNQSTSGDNEEYPMKCSSCDFKAASNVQLQKHKKVRHEGEEKSKKQCIYWLRGYCFKENECNFKHEALEVCRHGLQCLFWPNCQFFHPDVKPCKFQEYCQNTACTFGHFLGAGMEMQPPPLNNYQNFPPLIRGQGFW